MDNKDKAKPPEPRRRALTLAERIAVLEQHEKNPSTRHLARLFNCGRTQIQNILRNREDYLAEWNNNGVGDPNRIRRRQTTAICVLNTITFEYVKRCLSNSFQLNDEILKMAGTEICKILKINNIKTSNRWLERFKNRYKLTETDLKTSYPFPEYKDKSLKLAHIIEDIKKTLNFNKFPLQQPTETDLDNLKTYRTVSIVEFLRKKRLFTNKCETNLKTETNSNNVKILNLKQKQIPEPMECIDLSDSGDESQEKLINQENANGSGGDCDDDNRQPILVYVSEEPNPSNNEPKVITNYKDAIEYLKPLEEFTLLNEDLRAIGLLNQLENYFKDKLQK